MPFTDYLQNLRFENLFPQQSMIGMPEYPGPPIMSGQSNSRIPNLADLYQPETQYTDRFGQLMDQFPQRQNPSRMQKLFASLSAIGDDPEGMEQNLYGNFNRRLGDWQAQAGPTLQAANLERQNNQIMRQIADSIINRNIQQQRADEYERRGDTQAKEAASREEIARKKLELQQSINASKLSDADKHKLQLDLINAKTDAEFKIIAERAKAESGLIKERTSGQVEVKTTPGAPPIVPSRETTETVTDAEGKVVGTRETKSGPPASKTSKNMALMYGPNGEGPYSIPIEKTDEAQEKYGMRFKK